MSWPFSKFAVTTIFTGIAAAAGVGWALMTAPTQKSTASSRRGRDTTASDECRVIYFAPLLNAQLIVLAGELIADRLHVAQSLTAPRLELLGEARDAPVLFGQQPLLRRRVQKRMGQRI